MSSVSLRVTLNAVDLPMLYRDASRGTVLPNLDQVNTRIRGTTNPDWNSPQLLYAENVLPISRGFVSTQVQDLLPATGDTDFDQAITLRDRDENNTLFVPGAGKNYILDINTGTFNSSLPFSFTHKLVTRAYTQGRTFIFYEKEKLFEYDSGTASVVDRTADLVFPTGYSLADIRGIGGASNYLLLFTDIDVLWSSPTDPLNFDRALNNGSGYQIPQDVRGAISCILPVSGGAIIYTVRNAVAATFTNNAATPFVFRGIPNSGGVAGYEQVAYDADERAQYVWGSGGLQSVSLQNAESVFPEVSDFLTAGRYETYNYTTHLIEETKLTTYFDVKLTFISNRFLVVSYGPTPGLFTFALIYDSTLQRWGKVKVDHVDAFSYPYPGITGDLEYDELFVDYAGIGTESYSDLGVGVISVNPPKKSIAFLEGTGKVSILVMDYAPRSQSGVAVLGQLSHNRNNWTALHEVELEGVEPSSSPKVYDLVSLNGKTTDRAVEYVAGEVDGEYRMHYGREVGKHHNIAIEGAFQLTGFLARVAKHGRY